MAALLLLGYHIFSLGWWYLAGWGLCTAVLVYEHAILSEDDLSRLNVAFFNLNGVISIVLCLFTYLDLAL
jgi:4-hydroxybenzoate polyprenyltransferase